MSPTGQTCLYWPIHSVYHSVSYWSDLFVLAYAQCITQCLLLVRPVCTGVCTVYITVSPTGQTCWYWHMHSVYHSVSYWSDLFVLAYTQCISQCLLLVRPICTGIYTVYITVSPTGQTCLYWLCWNDLKDRGQLLMLTQQSGGCV